MSRITPLRKPEWIRVKVPSGETWQHVTAILERRSLHTVCDEARCPNKGECWGAGTATFMILGDTCTRKCRFCAVATAKTGQPVLPEEAEQLALAVQELGLKYAVLTSVDRDDLADRGAHHFACCIRAIKDLNPAVRVEVLIPDFVEGEIEAVLEARPDVVAHNIETVRSLQQVRDRRASYEKSLHTLYLAKQGGISVTKSSMLLGLGEQVDEVLSAMDDLRSVGVDVLVLGQYLQPGPKQLPVVAYIHPDQFREYARIGREKGFSTVVASPFARTSYHAQEAWHDGTGGKHTAHEGIAGEGER
ncbi:lipoyl synthase [Gracilinema caldarium]|nr:lipoyl synthase [Gracilinema caldarium]